MASTLYVKKPGGVIVHLKDGASEFKPYGAKIDVDLLADHQHQYLDRVADENRRTVSPEESDLQQRIQEAHNASVTAHGGQVYSSADVVPGDYGKLDEDGAIALMRSLESYPQAQAQVLLHERINFGREAVIDSASDGARAEANFLLEQVEEQVLATHQRVATPLHRSAPAADDDGPKKSWTKAKLLEYADEHDIEMGDVDGDNTQAEIFAQITAPAESSSPSTPPPAA